MKMRKTIKSMLAIVIFISVGAGATFASVTNVALNADVTLHGGQFFYWAPNNDNNWGWNDGYAVNEDTIVDGVFLPKDTQWDHGAVWWVVRYGNPDCWITIDLGNTATIESFVVQADDNDGYELYYWDFGSSSWQLAWDVPNYDAHGWGMQTRPNSLDDTERYLLPSPIVTNQLKFKGTLADSDLGFSVSEIQAFGTATPTPIPAPGALVLGSMGVGFVVWLRRRRTL